MIDAGAITELVLACGALAAAAGVPLVLARRQDQADGKRDAISSWAQLNDALQEEIRRVTGEMERQRDANQRQFEAARADQQRQLEAARADYQGQLDASRKRISELEAEVAALHRALRGPGT